MIWEHCGSRANRLLFPLCSQFPRLRVHIRARTRWSFRKPSGNWESGNTNPDVLLSMLSAGLLAMVARRRSAGRGEEIVPHCFERAAASLEETIDAQN
jgi:hypothetical protein